jgi:hypothetical protein
MLIRAVRPGRTLGCQRTGASPHRKPECPLMRQGTGQKCELNQGPNFACK